MRKEFYAKRSEICQDNFPTIKEGQANESSEKAQAMAEERIQEEQTRAVEAMEEGQSREPSMATEAIPLLWKKNKTIVYDADLILAATNGFPNGNADSMESVLDMRGDAFCFVPGWAAYNKALDERPLIAKACTSLVGWAISAILAQLVVPEGPTFDVKRLVTLSAFGFFYHGPSGHYFYNWLDGKIPGKDGVSVCKKILIDQTMWCPLFVTVFFVYLGLVNGDSVATICTKVRTDLFSGVQTSWKVWPLAHFINFKFVQNKHRLLYLNTVEVGFSMLLLLIGTKT